MKFEGRSGKFAPISLKGLSWRTGLRVARTLWYPQSLLNQACQIVIFGPHRRSLAHAERGSITAPPLPGGGGASSAPQPRCASVSVRA